MEAAADGDQAWTGHNAGRRLCAWLTSLSILLNQFGGFTTPQIPDGIYFYGGDRASTDFGPRPDYGRHQVRLYIPDNALSLLRDYGVDGPRLDNTDIRTFGPVHTTNNEGVELLQEINSAYRNTDRKPTIPGLWLRLAT